MIDPVTGAVIRTARVDSKWMGYRPWEEKFAWFPTIVNKRLIWLKTYYVRYTWLFPNNTNPQKTVSIFDVLKDN